METLNEALTRLAPAIIERSTERIRRTVPAYSKMSVEDVSKRVQDALAPMLKDLAEGTNKHYYDYMRELSMVRARQGVPMVDALMGIQNGVEGMIEAFFSELPDDNSIKLTLIDQAHRITERGMIGMAAGYEESQVQIIDSQQTALEELSIPIVPVYGGVLVLPIVGTIDSRRAGQIMEGLLEGINANSADVVILDITGVPVIDTGVANYLLQAARAARLLGSTVVLVGIGAEIAQTIVQLGIDLAGITTRANLQAGIEYALDMQGLAIQTKAA